MCDDVQVLQRLPVILESMIVPSEDEDLVFLTRLLQVTSRCSPLLSPAHVMLNHCITLCVTVQHHVWLSL